MNVLVVDDNPTNRKLLRAVLECEGITTEDAADGLEAIAALESKAVDAVISDILMPRMDGYRLCYEVRKSARFRDLPFIIYTATYLSPEDRQLALDLGADRFLAKPSSAQAILEALRGESAQSDQRTRRVEPSPVFEAALMKEYSERLIAKLEDKNITLEEQLKIASLRREVTTALMAATGLGEILQNCCQTIVERLQAAFARIWTHNEKEHVLELQASAGMYTHIDGPHGRVPVGQLKIGLIASERLPHVTNSVIGDARVPEQDWARREGLCSFAGYPLIAGERLLGVVAMFARQPLSQVTMDSLRAVADLIALGIRRHEAEEELRLANSQLRRLLSRSPMALYNLKIEGQTITPTYVSDNLEEVVGTPPDQALSYEWWLESLHPEDRERMVATLDKAFQDGGYTAEYRVRHRDGTYRWVLDANRVEYDASGAPQEIAGVWTDITEHKQTVQRNQELEAKAAEALAASRAKSRFLATMSHEIRTPMNAILGYAQLMMRDTHIGEDARANLDIIHRSGEHLLALINDVLDMSKIESGYTALSPVTFHLPVMLKDLTAMFRLRAEAKGIRFALAGETGAARYITADEGKIRQILINLLGNAIKFTQQGQVMLRIALEEKTGRLWMSVAVEDTGPGISEEDQGALFEPFHQLRTHLNSLEGTGLGLAISRNYARLMGGDLTLRSNPGQGSTFLLEIPVEPGDAGPALRHKSQRRVTGIRAKESPRVLIADDQLYNRDWLAKLLASIGFGVRSAESGSAAVELWRQWRPNLILMDVHMPILDGLEATRRIRRALDGTQTAIIALTASATEDDRRMALQSGADDFLPKPCREDDLLDKIQALLKVVYVYEETAPAPEPPPILTAEGLRRLPPELIAQLREATASGDKKRLDEMILSLGTPESATARALRALADRYEYDALAGLLEQACQR